MRLYLASILITKLPCHRYMWSRQYYIQDENCERLIELEGPYLWDYNCCPKNQVFKMFVKSKEIGLITVSGERNFHMEISCKYLVKCHYY
jgi:hypothetical protein